ncbi:MAG TPA: hemerythrin domain-containing protein [Thermoleophilia bacterium]|nr:hemerythrin domain-containing protein [Thermoleophilia bacterium]
MGPTTRLRREHQELCRVINAADRKTELFVRTGRVDGAWVRSFVEFSRGFTEGFHQAKEERLLLRRLRERAPAETLGVIGAMLAEHEGGRVRMDRLLDRLPAAEEGDETAVLLATEQLSAYVCLLEAHIAQEHNVLFPLAERVLAEDDVRWLDRASEEVELGELGVDERARLDALAAYLAGDGGGR